MSSVRQEIRIRLLAQHGINVADLSANEWLALALDAEQMRRDAGPFDPAFEYLYNRERYLTEAAEIAEMLNHV